MDFNRTISFPAHIMFQQFDDEAVLLDIRTQEHFGLDGVAALFITHLKQSNDLKQAFEHVMDNYAVEEEELSKDLEQLLEQLQAYKLIDIV